MHSISITAATLIGNRGSEAMLTTTVHEIKKRKPNTTINIFSYYPRHDKLLLNDKSINIFSSAPEYLLFVLFPASIIYKLAKTLKLKPLISATPQAIRSLGNSNVLIDLAGISFVDGREKLLPYNTLSILPAIVIGTPVVKFSQAMGPFQKKINRIISKLILPRCNMIYARGGTSLSHLNQLGINKTKFQLASDIAFLHTKNCSLTTENESYFNSALQDLKANKKKIKLLVGISPNAVIYKKHKKPYLKSLIKLIKYFQNTHHTVLIFPNATLPFSKLKNNDLVIIEELKKSFPKTGKKSNIIFIDHCINTGQIKNLIGLCDLTIVSRFHAMIASLSLGVPPIVIGWSHKYAEVMNQFGLENFVLDYKNFNINKIKQLSNQIEKQNRQIKKTIKSQLPRNKKSARVQINYIRNKFLTS
jgi:colanic acid/amylovoran biosynthesis protein